jgi:hypothetical protein|tara:strand:- start:5891 stop:6301 length:411 start_codon:yes stop_codon:yes gene_type:complete
MELAVGNTVTLKVKNEHWELRAAYELYRKIPEFNYYSGTIVTHKWFKPNEVGLSTGDPTFPFRRIRKEQIVSVDDEQANTTTFAETPLLGDTTFSVPGSKGSVYTVQLSNGKATCDCTGFQYRKSCKHVNTIQERT